MEDFIKVDVKKILVLEIEWVVLWYFNVIRRKLVFEMKF